MRADGELFVLEANANPNISAAEVFAQSALTAGMSYDELLQRIMQLGENYPAAWRAVEPWGACLARSIHEARNILQGAGIGRGIFSGA